MRVEVECSIDLKFIDLIGTESMVNVKKLPENTYWIS